MSNAIKDVGALVGVIGLVVLLVWVFVSATNYNASATTTCDEAGLTMVQEWPMGHFGCADVIPFDEVEKRR